MVDLKKANNIYKKLKNKLENHKGEIIAIETDSGDYFIGKDLDEAAEKAEEKHPDKQFYFIRIGFKYVYSIGAHSI